MGKQRPNPCEACGKSARVLILDGYSAGKPLFRRLCLDCADDTPPAPAARWTALYPLLIIVGAYLGAGNLLGDWIGLTGADGFGRTQVIGLIVGIAAVALGGVFRIDLLALGGAVVFGMALIGDLAGLRGSQGFGWKQQVGLGVAVALIAAGWIGRRQAAKRLTSVPVSVSCNSAVNADNFR